MSEGQDLDIDIVGPTETIAKNENVSAIVENVPTAVDRRGEFNPPGTEMITIPNNPHVFNVKELTVFDPDHNPAKLTDIKVLLSHGIRVNGKWQFLAGGDVVETVNSYNKDAVERGVPPIEFLVVCNQIEPEPLNVRVGDFDANQQIAYSVGTNVSLRQAGMSKVENGKTIMAVASDQTFFGLDRLISHKNIQSQIKIH